MALSFTHPKARTVALVGASGSGKTSLLDALVCATGGLARPGKVAEGSTLCGTDPEERRHQMSLGIGMAPLWVGGDKLTILDTPGFIDFHGEVRRALDVADVAVLVVNAVAGVQADTAIIWDMALAAGVPALAGLSWEDIPDTGLPLDGAQWSGLPFVEGETLHHKPAK